MAYYTLYGEFAPTYEAVMLKSFFHGRTEAGRSCTSEFCDFAKVFIQVRFGDGFGPFLG